MPRSHQFVGDNAGMRHAPVHGAHYVWLLLNAHPEPGRKHTIPGSVTGGYETRAQK